MVSRTMLLKACPNSSLRTVSVNFHLQRAERMTLELETKTVWVRMPNLFKNHVEIEPIVHAQYSSMSQTTVETVSRYA